MTSYSRSSLQKLLVLGAALWICCDRSGAETGHSSTATAYEALHAELRLTKASAGQPCCEVVVRGFTNGVFYLPVESQRWEAWLVGPAGEALSKTKIGKQFGQPLAPDEDLLDPLKHGGPMRTADTFRHATFGRPDCGRDYGSFDPLSCWKISQAGIYTLRVQPRIFRKFPDGTFTGIELTPVEVPLIVDPEDLPHWPVLHWAMITLLCLLLCIVASRIFRRRRCSTP